MMISKKLSDAFTTQVKAEMWSSNLYLSMAIYFRLRGLRGFEHWMIKQAEEEMTHAHRMINYVVDRGGDVHIQPIDGVPAVWDSIEKVYADVYTHECKVTEMLDSLMEIAMADKDFASQDLLYVFIREQVEEEATAKEILEKIKFYDEGTIGILDRELGQRP